MNRPPSIGVIAFTTQVSWGLWHQEAHLLPSAYTRPIEQAGGIAVPILPNPRVQDSPDWVLGGVDALMLLGGPDLDPRSYGEQPGAALEETSPRRDGFEYALTRAALDAGLPFLGICRGLQVLNVLQGGRLRQDIGPLALQRHRRALGTFEQNEHTVRIVPGTLIEQIVGAAEHTVRCHHHQAISELGAGLKVTAVADDDVIEAVELAGHPFALGVQWHPEADPESPVIAALVSAAAKSLES